MLDPAGVTRTKALGSDRMGRKLAHAFAGRRPRAASERLGVHASDALAGAAALNRDTFISDESNETTVYFQAHRATSDLDELDLDDEQTTKAA